MAQADRALLIGIDSYENFKKEAGLAGCLNDVVLMERILLSDGFSAGEISTWTNNEATKPKIESWFTNLKPRKDRERLVIYYSGHGRAYPESGLLTYKSLPDNPSQDLSIDEMEGYLKGAAQKGFRVTVILDSCFSGMIVRSTTGKSKVLASRRSKDVILLNAMTEQQLREEARLAKVEGGSICYVAACRPLESAREVALDGESLKEVGLRSSDSAIKSDVDKEFHFGLFTLNFYNEVMKKGAQQAWQTVMTGVSESIALSKFEGIQTPVYSPKFWDYRMFDNVKLADVPPNPKLLAKIQQQYPADDRLRLKLLPDGIPLDSDMTLEQVYVGQPIRIAFEDELPGRFHVAIEFDGKQFKRLFPPGNEAIASPSGPFLISSEKGPVWACTEPTEERFVVFSFDNKERAQELINAMPFAKPRSPGDLKDVRGVADGPSIMVAKKNLRIMEGLVGTARILDAEKVAKFLMEGQSSAAKALLIRMPTCDQQYIESYLKGEAEETEVLWGLARLCYAAKNGIIDQILQPEQLAEVKLRATTAEWIKKFDKLDASNRSIVNRMILEDVFGTSLISPGNEPTEGGVKCF